MYAGPYTYANELAFGYDTGEFSTDNVNYNKAKPHKKHRGRYYRGRPTVNYIAHQNAVPQDSYVDYVYTTSGTWAAKHPKSIRAYNSLGQEITLYTNTGVTDWTNTYHAHWQYDDILKKPVTVMDAFDSNWKAKSFATGIASFASLGLTAGSKYVISWLQYTTNLSKSPHVGLYTKNSSNSSNFWDGLSNNSTTSRNTKTHTWQRVYHVYTVSATRDLNNAYASIYMYGHHFINGAGITLKIADVQLELGIDHPTSYIEPDPTSSIASRSNTESLINIANNTGIDVSTVSYGENGFITFDGTDDYITMGDLVPDTSWSEPWSIEVVFNIPSSYTWNTSRYTTIMGRGSYGGSHGLVLDTTDNRIRAYIRADNGTRSVTAGITRDTYYYAVMTWNGTDLNLYVNGALIGTNSGARTGVPDGGDWFVARARAYSGSLGGWFTGRIPVAKLHNISLSSAKIKQNFRAYRNRFKLS